MALGGEGLWCGASLRPWQILHSRLARMHTCGLLERDVWDLMDETVEAAYPLREYKKEDLQYLEGDDGELWRHGGLMEARIRDWLTSKIEEERQEDPYNYCTSATYRGEFSETGDRKLEEEEVYEIAGDANYEAYIEEEDKEDEDNYCYNGANTVATYRSEFSGTWDSTLEEAMYGRVAEEEENDDDNDGYPGANLANAAILAAPLDAETHYWQFSEDLQAREGGDQLHEEDEQICAVCLEKLYTNEDQLQEFSVNNITRLPCSHSFHSHCLSPWLSASSFCPCCRAPIISPLHLEAPPNLGLAGNCSDAVHLDMMGLLAEMEAALDRFGLLS